MFEFYQQQRPDGTSPKMGDGIAFGFGISHRSGRTPYELLLTRLFTSDDQNPGPHGSRLRLSFCYSWLEATPWFEERDFGLHNGNSRFAWNVASAAVLYDQLQSHEVYKILSGHLPKYVVLRYEPQWEIFP